MMRTNWQLMAMPTYNGAAVPYVPDNVEVDLPVEAISTKMGLQMFRLTNTF